MLTLKLEMDGEEVECVLLALAVRKASLDNDVKMLAAMTTQARAPDMARDCQRQSDWAWQAYLKIARALDDARFGCNHES